jgi:hypothetical protein
VQLRFKLDIFLPDLVGTTAVPAHAFDVAELTDLTPTLDTATAAHGTADQGAEAAHTGAIFGGCKHSQANIYRC